MGGGLGGASCARSPPLQSSTASADTANAILTFMDNLRYSVSVEDDCARSIRPPTALGERMKTAIYRARCALRFMFV